MDTRVRITGFGGQGVITAGYIFGQAVAIFDDNHSIFTQSYGPEARGSACAARVVVSDKQISNPFFNDHDILVALSQEGFDKYIESSVKGGIVFVDSDLVDVSNVSEKTLKAIDLFFIPCTRLAESDIGWRIVTNIVMLGHFAQNSSVVSLEAMEKSILKATPTGTEDINKRAFRLGVDFKPQKKPIKTVRA